MCLMSVVLPAPFAPTRPKTWPRVTSKETLSSATLAPKRRESPAMAMTMSLEEGHAGFKGFISPPPVAWFCIAAELDQALRQGSRPGAGLLPAGHRFSGQAAEAARR